MMPPGRSLLTRCSSTRTTYLGGSGSDTGIGIAMDDAGNAYLTGVTSSRNFPTMNPLQPAIGGPPTDAFVTKVNADGSALVYSTYLGGSGLDRGLAVAVDAGGNAVVTGETRSTNFPTANPLQPTYGGGTSDAFVAKVNTDGSALIYSTYLGGSSRDLGQGIAVDDAGNVHVTGDTNSTNFPTMNPLQPSLGGGGDAFVAKLNADGSALVYSTYLGGSRFDAGRGIAADSAGNAYVTGDTNSTNFPNANPLQPPGGDIDAFVAKVNADGSALVYSTYLGGSEFDQGIGIAVGADSDVSVTGETLSLDFPTRNPLQAVLRGSFDAFVAKIGDPDISPPSVSCSVMTSLLWPPNHQLINVGLSVNVADEADPNPTVQVLVFGNDGADSSDVAETGPNTLRLRAERSGNGGGRVYLIVVTATDRAGNVGFDACAVVVPHSQSPAAIESINREAAVAVAFYRESQTAPPGYLLLGEGS